MAVNPNGCQSKWLSIQMPVNPNACQSKCLSIKLQNAAINLIKALLGFFLTILQLFSFALYTAFCKEKVGYFTYPGNHHKFIRCTGTKGSFVYHCGGYVWVQHGYGRGKCEPSSGSTGHHH